MARAIRIPEGELHRALEEGADWLIVGKRRFLLVEVEEADSGEVYDVTDPAEVAVVREALQDASPRRSGPAARHFLKARLKDHGVS